MATEHVDVASGSKELNFKFDLILININFNSHKGLVATILDSISSREMECVLLSLRLLHAVLSSRKSL